MTDMSNGLCKQAGSSEIIKVIMYFVEDTYLSNFTSSRQGGEREGHVYLGDTELNAFPYKASIASSQ